MSSSEYFPTHKILKIESLFLLVSLKNKHLGQQKHAEMVTLKMKIIKFILPNLGNAIIDRIGYHFRKYINSLTVILKYHLCKNVLSIFSKCYKEHQKWFSKAIGKCSPNIQTKLKM